MPIGPEDVCESHLHGTECFSYDLRSILVRQDALDASAACSEPGGLGQHFRRKVTNLLGPLHASISEERESGLVSLRQPEYGGKEVECDPVGCEAIHMWGSWIIVSSVRHRVGLHSILHLLSQQKARDPFVGKERGRPRGVQIRGVPVLPQRGPGLWPRSPIPERERQSTPGHIQAR